MTPSELLAIIGPINCLSPVWCHAITWTNADISLMGPYAGTIFSAGNSSCFIRENALGNIVYMMVVILDMPQQVKRRIVPRLWLNKYNSCIINKPFTSVTSYLICWIKDRSNMRLEEVTWCDRTNCIEFSIAILVLPREALRWRPRTDGHDAEKL